MPSIQKFWSGAVVGARSVVTEDVPPYMIAAGNPARVINNADWLLSLDLDGPYRLYFRPAQDPPPAKPDGGLDWSRVTEVVIEKVYDPHE